MILFSKKMDQVDFIFLINPGLNTGNSYNCLHHTAIVYEARQNFSSAFQYDGLKRIKRSGLIDQADAGMYTYTFPVKSEILFGTGETETFFLYLLGFLIQRVYEAALTLSFAIWK